MKVQPQTIGSLIEEFLAKKGIPCQIDEIADDKQFISFGRRYVGFRGKKYNLKKWTQQNLAALGTSCDLLTEFLAGKKESCY